MFTDYEIMTVAHGLLALRLRSLKRCLGIGLNAAAREAVRAAKVRRTVPGIDPSMTPTISAVQTDRPASLLRHMRIYRERVQCQLGKNLSAEGSELAYL